MREIKFRAIDENGVWWYFTLEDLVRGDSPANTGVLKNWCEYIGVPDKNGKEIYEGDISEVRYAESVRRIGSSDWEDIHFIDTVVFVDGMWKNKNNDDVIGVIGKVGGASIEVIGNIYENPELLTQ